MRSPSAEQSRCVLAREPVATACVGQLPRGKDQRRVRMDVGREEAMQYHHTYTSPQTVL